MYSMGDFINAESNNEIISSIPCGPLLIYKVNDIISALQKQVSSVLYLMSLLHKTGQLDRAINGP